MTPHTSETSEPGNCVISAWPLAFDILLTAHCVERKVFKSHVRHEGVTVSAQLWPTCDEVRRINWNNCEIQFLIVLDAFFSSHVCFDPLDF